MNLVWQFRVSTKLGHYQPIGGILFDRKSLRALLVNRKIAGFGYFKDDWNQFPKLQDDKSMVRWEFRHGPVINTNLFEKAQSILCENAKYNHRIYKDQRTYFLSGILFDRDGNRLRGESAKKKSNVYYINPAKKYRVHAEKIEKTVVDYVGSLLKKNGILDQAVKNFFHGKNPGLEKLEAEIMCNSTEIKKCERLLEILAGEGRDKMLANPNKTEQILLEGIAVRKQTQARLDELRDDSKALSLQKKQIYKFKDKDNMQNHIKKAMALFEASSSKRKKRLIQLMVPKLVLDEKQDQLFLFINPFLENSCKNSIEKFDDFDAILPKFLIQDERKRFTQVPESSCEILSHRGKKVRVAEDWRNVEALCKPFFLHTKLLGITRYYVEPLYKNSFFLQRKYISFGLSARQIATEIFSSKTAVLNALARFGIPVRDPHFNHGNPSQPRFGKRFQKRYLIDDAIEQRVIQVVSELRAQGLSFRKIAKVLTKMRVATKCLAKSWHPEMVRRIVESIDTG